MRNEEKDVVGKNMPEKIKKGDATRGNAIIIGSRGFDTEVSQSSNLAGSLPSVQKNPTWMALGSR